jgi:hypothetical protein
MFDDFAKPTTEERRREIVGHPENHMHNYEQLMACCMVDGALDTMLLQSHEGIFGSNGGSRCDVGNGPCSCGAWH